MYFKNIVFRCSALYVIFCVYGNFNFIRIYSILGSFYRKDKGTASVLIPGGALEALNSDADRIRLVLNRRKGFIKMALRFGVDLVPSFSFGENFIYDQVKSQPGKVILHFSKLSLYYLITWCHTHFNMTPCRVQFILKTVK